MSDWLLAAWARHDREPETLARELEARIPTLEDDAALDRYLKLSNHTIGSHLHDWSRARRLAQQAVDARGQSSLPASVLAQLALAQFLDGDAGLALATEALALAHSERDAVFEVLAGRLQLAQRCWQSDASGPAQQSMTARWSWPSGAPAASRHRGKWRSPATTSRPICSRET